MELEFVVHSNLQVMEDRWKRVLGWLKGHDVVILPEAHTDVGRVDSWTKRCGAVARAFEAVEGEVGYSRSTAGMVVLARNDFLKGFDVVKWEVLDPGYMGLLTLEGSKGILQIAGVYGRRDSPGRCRQWSMLKGALLPPELGEDPAHLEVVLP